MAGDLISINKRVVGAIIGNAKSWTLVDIESGQNALVLETYDPKALSNHLVARAADEMLQAQQERVARKVSPNKRPPYKNVPEQIVIMVLTIGETIVEAVYDPDHMSIISF